MVKSLTLIHRLAAKFYLTVWSAQKHAKCIQVNKFVDEKVMSGVPRALL